VAIRLVIVRISVPSASSERGGANEEHVGTHLEPFSSKPYPGCSADKRSALRFEYLSFYNTFNTENVNIESPGFPTLSVTGSGT
jgi:hypothetical protein